MGKIIFAGLAFLSLVAGCGPADKNAAAISDSVVLSCGARSSAAITELKKVIDANGSCAIDSDCVWISNNTDLEFHLEA